MNSPDLPKPMALQFILKRLIEVTRGSPKSGRRLGLNQRPLDAFCGFCLLDLRGLWLCANPDFTCEWQSIAVWRGLYVDFLASHVGGSDE